MFREWLKKLIAECLIEYYKNRPSDKIITNRSPCDLDYHYYPGTTWENSFNKKVYILDKIAGHWVEKE